MFIKKQRTPILFVLLFFSFSCSKKEDLYCGTQNPLQELFWLKQMKEGFDMDMSPSRQKIDIYTYNDQSVFMISHCVTCPDAMEVVYNCEGKIICEFGGIAGLNTCPDFETKANYIKTLYDQ